MVRAICGVLFIARKRSTHLMSMLGLSKNIDQLAMSDSVR